MKILPILFLLFFNSYVMAKYLPIQLDQSNYTAAGCAPSTPFLMILLLLTLLVGKIFMIYPKQDKTILKPNQTTVPKTTFVFDLHGVVFSFNPLKACHDALISKHKKKLFWAAINPFLIWDILKLLHNSSVVEEAIMAIGYKYPHLKELIPLALQMANEQVPITATVELIKQIKQSGFKILVFSNIGEQSAAILQAKYPEIFGLFDGLLFTTPQDHYVMKPSQQAFNKFFKKFEVDKDQIIFIDDKQSNIYVARQMGISAIQFVSPYQCRLLINKMGFPILKTPS